MDWLNYHHLRYFWAVAKEGGVTRASERLHVSQPTISAQLRELEEALGEKLFAKSGRALQLTDAGRVAYRYADEIFGLGRELVEGLKGLPTGRPAQLRVGLDNALPKLIAYRLLEPALKLDAPVHIVCQENKPQPLLAALAMHELDIVLTDAPVAGRLSVRAYNHLLGECAATIFATRRLAAAHRRQFPRSLDGAPMLLPTPETSLRRSLDEWFEANGIRPKVVGEFEDSALLKVFGEAGLGLFAAPTAAEADIVRRYDVSRVGVIDGVRERFYAITVERRLKHPAVVAISASARESLFA